MESSHRFGAGKAILTFFLIQLATIVTSFVIGFFAWRPYQGHGMTVRELVSTLFVAYIVTAVATAVVMRVWAWHLVMDRSEKGIGLFVPPKWHLVLAGFVGLAIAAGSAAGEMAVDSTAILTCRDLASTAMASGIGVAFHVMWILGALVLNPLVDECLYRGVLLKGFEQSWGTTGAAIAVTVLAVGGALFSVTSWPDTWARLCSTAPRSLREFAAAASQRRSPSISLTTCSASSVSTQ